MPKFTTLQKNYLASFPEDEALINKLFRKYGVVKMTKILTKVRKDNGRLVLNKFIKSGCDYFIISKDAKVTNHNIKRTDNIYSSFKDYSEYWKEFTNDTTGTLNKKELDAINCEIWDFSYEKTAKKHNISTGKLRQIAERAKQLLFVSERKEFYKYWVKNNIKSKIKGKELIRDFEKFSFLYQKENTNLKDKDVKPKIKVENSEDIVKSLLKLYSKRNVCRILLAAHKRNGKIILNTNNPSYASDSSGYDFFIVSKKANATKSRVKMLDYDFTAMRHYHYMWDEFSKETKILEDREIESINEFIWNLSLDKYAKKHSFSSERARQILAKSLRRLKQTTRVDFYRYWEAEKLKNPLAKVSIKNHQEYLKSKFKLSSNSNYTDLMRKYEERIPNSEELFKQMQERNNNNWDNADYLYEANSKNAKVVVNKYKRSGVDCFIVSLDAKISDTVLRMMDKRYLYLKPYLKHWDRMTKEIRFLNEKDFDCINDFLMNGNLEKYAKKYEITINTATAHLNKSINRLKQEERIKAYNEWVKIDIENTYIDRSIETAETDDFALKQIFKSIENDTYKPLEDVKFPKQINYILSRNEIYTWEKLLKHSEEDFIHNNARKDLIPKLKNILDKFDYKLSYTKYNSTKD